MRLMKKHTFLLMLGFLALTLLASCADTEAIQPCLTGRQYGFFFGLLHGFITPLSFIGSLFKDDVSIYAVNNSGGWYDLGFLLGSSGWGFLASHSTSKK